MIHPEHGDDARLHRDRCADRRARCCAAAGARDRRASRSTAHGRRRHVDQRQLRACRDRRRGDAADRRRAATRASAPSATRIAEVATELAQAIVRDGEGATKFITIARRGRPRRGGVPRGRASAIAHSPLVKTAFFASDPNLGRIVARSATRRSPTSIRRACRSGSTTCRWSHGGGRASRLSRGGRPARDEAGARSPCAWRSAAAARRRRSGPAISRTIT